MRNGNQGAIKMSYIEKFWRDATAADVARVMAGEEVEARFRDKESQRWQSGFRLGGWMKCKAHPWLDGDASTWTFCQVYDPPQWFIDKPDPGDGYRLLGKFPDEALQVGDEAVTVAGLWHKSEQARICGRQVEGIWYRRKIEQPKPEPKFTVGQRVRIIGPKARPAPIWEQAMDCYIGEIGTVKAFDGLSFGFMHQVDIAVGWNFHQDYLEPAVEPEPKHYTLQVGDTISTPSWRQAIVTEHGIEVT